MTMKLTPLGIIFLTIAAVPLTGCGLQQAAPIPVQGHALHGSVHGGQQPVTQASLQLYAAGATNYGVGATYTNGISLLKNPVTTDSNGFFTITGDYTCPSSSTLVYLVSTGGNPGVGTGTNSNLSLMAALGPCGPLVAGTSYTFINLNEVTTVASVWALSPFMSGISSIGTSASNIQGLTNAFNNVNKLVNITTGNASGPALPAGSTLPVGKINTLANILASCVNSDGGVAGDSSSCGKLFYDTTVGSVVPKDTVTAAMNLAQNPNLNTSALYMLPSKTPPFGPILSGAPADFGIVISHSGGGIAAPASVATDAVGNIWIANAGTPNSITKLDPTGAPLSGAGGYALSSLNKPSAIAIDLNGNAWVANSGTTNVIKISGSSGTATTVSGGKLNGPFSLAVDGSNNVWVANKGDGSLTEINSNGTLTNYPGAGVSVPSAVTINPK
jgi:hypothetical protein